MTDPLINPPTAAEFQEVAGCIAAQTTSIEHLNTRLEISERRTMIIGAALVVLAALVALVIVLFVLVRNQNHQLAAQQERTDTIRAKSCDFYQLLLDYQTPQARATYPGGTARYDAGMQSLRTIMREIGCPER